MTESAVQSHEGRVVLADWYEEHGARDWAAWVRDDLAPEQRTRRLSRVLRARGWRVRPAHRLDQFEPAVVSPFLDTLPWTIEDAEALGPLLETPAFHRARRLHLADPKRRNALPTVLDAWARRDRPLEHLDVWNGTLSTALLEDLCPWYSLATRLVGSPATSLTLPLRALTVRIEQASDLLAWADIELPQLQRLRFEALGPVQGLSGELIESLLRTPAPRIEANLSLARALELDSEPRFVRVRRPVKDYAMWSVHA